jgi:myo-inositol-1(or 4)-monophosphatase
MTPDPGSLLRVAMQAADIAAEMMRTQRPASLTEKHDRDLVSDVDVAIERKVRNLLADATPDIGFLGEEEGRTGNADQRWLWTLDPIDGTSNFAHGIPLCATSLALLRDDRAVLAVIDAPLLGERFHAVEGQGAFAGAQRLSVRATTRLRDAVVGIGDYATGPRADRENEIRLAVTVQLAPRVHRLRMLGTAALDLAWVAAGRLDASVTLGNNPWDTAAGVLLAREAGATATDANGVPHNLDSAVTIAASPGLIDQLILLVHAADANDANRQDGHVRDLSPYASLDAVLSHGRHLVFDFDGPVCDLAAAMPADTAERLRALVTDENGQSRPGLARATDPFDVLADAAEVGAEVAARVDAELASIEATAAAGAVPAGYIHEAIAACRDSGRTPAVISRNSAAAVHAWLARHGLADQIRHVFAAGSYPPGHTQAYRHLIENVIQALRGAPADYALISASASSLDAARTAGVHSIEYATTPAASERLSAAGADSLVPSLADLTLRLRARPLPS